MQHSHFPKVRTIFFKTGLLFARSRDVGTRHGLQPLQPPVPLMPAGHWRQKVKDEAVKDLNLLFFVNFILKEGESSEKLDLLNFATKKCAYLTLSAQECF